ncbi:MAG: hypothetical protein AAF599_04670 [Bacteroidota bacterium]
MKNILIILLAFLPILSFSQGKGITSTKSVTSGGNDGAVTNVALNGTSLDFTGTGTATNQSVDLSSLSGGTDDQIIDLFNLNGTTLELSLENDGEAPQTVDLSGLGGGTDDQTASEVNISTITGLNATQVQAALEELYAKTLEKDDEVFTDGTNSTFTFSMPASANLRRVYIQGQLLRAGDDYNRSGSDITFLTGGTPTPPSTGQWIKVFFTDQ